MLRTPELRKSACSFGAAMTLATGHALASWNLGKHIFSAETFQLTSIFAALAMVLQISFVTVYKQQRTGRLGLLHLPVESPKLFHDHGDVVLLILSWLQAVGSLLFILFSMVAIMAQFAHGKPPLIHS